MISPHTNNGTEFPYQLSGHAAQMLRLGIETYMRSIISDYEKGIEEADYAHMVMHTAVNEAKKLLDWCDRNDFQTQMKRPLLALIQQGDHHRLEWGRKEEARFRRLPSILDFYKGEKSNPDGHSLGEMWGFSHGEFEMEHSYIQWMFPSNEPSMINCDAPVLTKDDAKIFQDDPDLREKLKYSFVKILDFFDFKLMENSEGYTIEPVQRPDLFKWMNFFNHNMLRVTRVLKSLRLCGHPELAQAFYKTLMNYKEKFSENTLRHWQNATFGDLWDTPDDKLKRKVDEALEKINTTQFTEISINGKNLVYPGKETTFEEIADLAGYKVTEDFFPTMTYHWKGPKDGMRTGIMHKGQKIQLAPGMRFSIAFTGDA